MLRCCVLDDMSAEYIKPVLESVDIDRDRFQKGRGLAVSVVGAKLVRDPKLATPRENHYVATVYPHHLAHFSHRRLQEMVQVYHRRTCDPAEDRFPRLVHLQPALGRDCFGVLYHYLVKFDAEAGIPG